MNFRIAASVLLVAAISAIAGFAVGLEVDRVAEGQAETIRTNWISAYGNLVDNSGNAKPAEAVREAVGTALVAQTYALGINFHYLSEDQVRGIKSRLPKVEEVIPSAYAEQAGMAIKCIESADAGTDIHQCVMGAMRIDPKKVAIN